ncbi:MAG TPA: ABC transporter ATP-binding protein [Gemmataceae bacterium]|jgi:manganese/zinc/iron transport system ATP- binding protein
MTNSLFPYGRRRHVDPVPAADALVADDLTVGYPGSLRPAVKQVCLRVPTGTRVALVGPNGAGKSSLLKAIAGLLPVSGGTLRVFGHAVGACRCCLAYLPQREEIDWRFPISVERLVLTGRYVHLGWLHWPKARDYQITRAVMERLGLSDLADRQIGRLSGGQQQRVLVARALAQGADLLLLDEPLNAVDANTRAALHNVFQDLHRQGKTVLVATHDLGRLANEFDAAVYLSDGRQVPPPEGAFAGLSVGKECAWTG